MKRDKSSKRFTISTEKKNSKGFRTRTAGIKLSQFRNNPLMYWMHQRPEGKSTDEILPLGGWEDIQVDLTQGAISGIPSFDKDDFSQKIYLKVESGTIRMASAGLEPIEWKMHEGELWLWESEMVEATIADRGANTEALASDVTLYEEGQLVTLSADYIKSVIPQIENLDMAEITLSSNATGLLKLSHGASAADADTAIQNLVTLSATQATEIVTLKADKEKAVKDLQEEKTKIDLSERKSYLDTKLTEGRFTPEQRKLYEAPGAEGSLNLSLDQVKGIVEGLPATQSVESLLNGEQNLKTEAKILKLSWDEADKSGELETIKLNHYDHFKGLYKTRFGKDYPS